MVGTARGIPVGRARRTSGSPLRRLIFLAAAASLLVIVANSVITASRESRDPALAYADLVRPAVDRSVRQAAALDRIREQAPAQPPATLSRALERLEGDSAAAYRHVTDFEPPSELAPAHGLLLATLKTRVGAVRRLAGALAAPPDTPINAVVDELLAVGHGLQVSDQAYLIFLDELPASAERTMPASTWVPDPSRWDQPEVMALASSVRAQAAQQPVRDVSVVAVTTDPGPVGADGNAMVLPTVRDVRVQVVVANQGNEAVRQVPVEVVATSTGGLDSARDFVDLEPGQRQTMVLTVRPSPVGVIELVARIGVVDGEERVDDNRSVARYVMR